MITLFFIFSAILNVSSIAAESPCTLSPVTALDNNSAIVKNIKDWANGNQSSLDEYEKAKIKSATEIYEVDIENNGHTEYAIPSSEGSGGYLAILFLAKTPSGFSKQSDLPSPVGSIYGNGQWYLHNCYARKPKTIGKNLFYTCGKETYFSVEGEVANTCPFYIWKEKSHSEFVCNSTVFMTTLSFAKNNSDAKKNQFAVNILNDYDQHCGSKTDPAQKFQILKQLAVNYASLKQPVDCKTSVIRANQIPGMGTDTSKELSVIEKQCELPTSFEPAIFENALTGTLTNALVDVTVPDYKSFQIDSRSKNWLKGGAIPYRVSDHQSVDLRQMLQENTGQPCYEKHIEQDQFVSIYGCRTHSINDKAGIWVDTKNHQSIFIINDFLDSPFKKLCVLIGSRTVSATQIPDAFWKSYQNFMRFTGDTSKSAACFLSEDKDGRSVLTYLETGSKKI